MSAIIECDELFYIYRSGDLEVVALQGLDLHVQEGEMIAIVGRSGSGKTTLMNVLAAMDTPSAGRIRVDGHDLTELSPRERVRYHRRVTGYLWQHVGRNLSPELTVRENIELPMVPCQYRPAARLSRALELLDALALGAHANHFPFQLSGGEQQRLGLAVALANQPRLLLADEPTGQLDRATARTVLEDLRSLQRSAGTTVVMVTHDHLVERHVDRVIRIRDGKTSTETRWVEGRSDELVIMDRAGRIQLPRAHLEALDLHDRVRVHRDGSSLVVTRYVPEDVNGA